MNVRDIGFFAIAPGRFGNSIGIRATVYNLCDNIPEAAANFLSGRGTPLIFNRIME